MSFIGPALPSHLLNHKKPSETGPQIPAQQQSTFNIYDDDDDGPKPATVTIGPSIPPEFSKAPQSRIDDDDDDDDGPDLPPHLRKGHQEEAGPSIPIPGPSTGKRQVGPTFPSYAPTYDPTTYHDDEDDEDDDDFGPKPLPAGMQHQQTDAVKEFIEREEKRRKLAEDAAKPKSLQRDEWMLVPPSSSSLLGNLDPTKLKARQFSRGSAPVNNKDNSLWTETPAERQQRLADEVSGKKRRVTDAPIDEDTTGAIKRRKQDEERIKRGVDEYTKKRRGPALVDQHAATKKPEEKDPAIWDHARDMGLGGRLMDDDKRKKMLKEAKGLGDRFGSGDQISKANRTEFGRVCQYLIIPPKRRRQASTSSKRADTPRTRSQRFIPPNEAPISKKISDATPYTSMHYRRDTRMNDLGTDMKGKFAGPISPLEFLQTFLSKEENLNECQGRGKRPSNIAALKHHCPGFDLVDTHNHQEMGTSKTKPAIKPDVSPYISGCRTDPTIITDISLVDIQMGIQSADTRGQSTTKQLASQFRTHAFSVIICKDMARLIHWDRSGAVVTQAFSYVEERWLAFFFWRYTYSSRAVHGVDESVAAPTDADAAYIQRARATLELDDDKPLFKFAVYNDKEDVSYYFSSNLWLKGNGSPTG
ncbi:hypothetical protein BYT27DRAFT_7247809 [Phlegmacium glaucopus]|nr:hypothetical protein BYT27DRAFT_7247809 [Phlegmacium glaucopus]